MKRQTTYDKEKSRRYILEKRRQMIAKRTFDKIRECENDLAILYRELDKLYGMDPEERMMSTEELLGLPHISAYGDFTRDTGNDSIRARINSKRESTKSRDKSEAQIQLETRMEDLKLREELNKYRSKPETVEYVSEEDGEEDEGPSEQQDVHDSDSESSKEPVLPELIRSIKKKTTTS